MKHFLKDAVRLNMNTTEQKTPAFYPELILYRDDLILIANKPAGIPIHETKDPLRPDFTRLLQNSLSLDYLRTANRLDLNTTGIVVFGLDPEGNHKVDELLKASRKFYLALVHGVIPEDEFRIESFLKDGNKKVQTVRSGGKKAITLFKVLKRDPVNLTTLVEVELVTGRRHQIRIHIAEYGHPIVGDKVYGDKTKKLSDEILYLHSYKLDLTSYKSDLVIICQPDWMI
ncbi:MAG: RNA pseudouridine synthase [Leptospira sp.]|nr:RNA pseudouridine synthase [Leptospira sp.]